MTSEVYNVYIMYIKNKLLPATLSVTSSMAGYFQEIYNFNPPPAWIP